MTDATNALLPCPFCGGDAEFLKPSNEHFSYVYCGQCGVETERFNGETQAANAWNRRQPTASAGMVVVPREPTEAMLDEADRACPLPESFIRAVYAAMLAAHESQSPNRQVREDSQGLGEPGRLPPHFPTGKHFTIEPHGDGYAIYQGRDWQHHGLSLGHLTECSQDMIALIERGLNATLDQSPNADTTPDVGGRGWEREADKLLIALGLDPVRFRTEGGLLNAGKIKAALKRPEDYSGLYLGRDCCKRCGSPKSKRMRSSAGNMDVCDDCGVPRFASGNKPTDNVEGE